MSQSAGSDPAREPFGPHDAYPPPPPGYGPGSWGQPPSMSTTDERTWGMLSHLGALVASLVTGTLLGLVVPLVVMLTKGKDSAFVRRQATESLNFQLTVLIVAVVGTVVGVLLALFTLGLALIVIIPAAIVYALFVLVMPIVASLRVNGGQDYRYPLTLRLVS